MHFSKKISPELYFIIIPSSIILLFLSIGGINPNLEFTIRYFFNPKIVIIIFSFVLCIAILTLWARLILGLKTSLGFFLKSILYVKFILILVIFIPCLLSLLCFASVTKSSVLKYTMMAAQLENNIFNSQPVSFIHGLKINTLTEKIIVYVYDSMVGIMYLTILISLFKKGVFREFMLLLFITTCMGSFFWYFTPVIAPMQIFKYNIFNLPLNNPLLINATDNPISQYMNLVIKNLYNFWQDPSYRFIASSAFPSMHVAWSMITAYAAIKIYKPLKWFFIPYIAITFVAIIYTYQHFLIDGIAAFIIVICNIYIVKRIDKNLIGTNYYFLDVLNETVVKLKSFILRT